MLRRIASTGRLQVYFRTDRDAAELFESIDAELDEIAPAFIFHSRYFPALEAISVRSEGAIRGALDQAACNGAARAKIR